MLKFFLYIKNKKKETSTQLGGFYEHLHEISR